jgi:hypothetical protein
MWAARDHSPLRERVEAALETSCAALIALQWIESSLVQQTTRADGLREHLTGATGTLQAAVDALRRVLSSGESVLALGFVVERSSF